MVECVGRIWLSPRCWLPLLSVELNANQGNQQSRHRNLITTLLDIKNKTSTQSINYTIDEEHPWMEAPPKKHLIRRREYDTIRYDLRPLVCVPVWVSMRCTAHGQDARVCAYLGQHAVYSRWPGHAPAGRLFVMTIYLYPFSRLFARQTHIYSLMSFPT